MKKYTAAFASITFAEKAKNILSSDGYEAKVIRTPRSLASGCGYSVVTDAPPEKITSLLEDFGITVKAISERH